MKKIISVLTATRAEYGLLRPIISKLIEIKEFEIKIVVTGSHLSSEFGLTYLDIEKDGYIIDRKIDILLSSDSPSSISKSMGLAMIGFADYFGTVNPDLLIILGDRFETLAVAACAMNQRIPIAHLYGGETTEGAIDESIRHALSKLSYLHFTSTEEYRKRVIQLGEHPDRVFNVGSTGVENILSETLLTKNELEQMIKIDLSRPYAIVTFHPVTLEINSSELQILELLEFCKEFKNINFIFTKANSDADGRIINRYIDEYAVKNDNISVFTSLGMVGYLSALKYSCVVIGNSSSGLIEAPSFGIPTINIGDRQKGRLLATSVVNCFPTKESILKSINYVLTPEFSKIAKNTINPYAKINTSSKVIEVIREFILTEKIFLKKTFYEYEDVK